MDPGWADVAWRVVQRVWRWHYRIPRWVYWAVITASVAGAVLLDRSTFAVPEGAILVACCVSAAGLVRWAIESRPTPVIVVPLFATPGRSDVAEETQRIIVTSLRDRASPQFTWRILPVADVVGSSEGRFARKLRARLRALYLLHGDVRVDPTGERFVYARLLVPDKQEIMHWDTFTGDTTPVRGPVREIVYRLTPSAHADSVEYPFDFTTELEAVLLGLEGTVEALVGYAPDAITTLKEAIVLSGNSDSHAIDAIRITLFDLLIGQGHTLEAFHLLRTRATSPSASPDLLRHLANQLIIQANMVKSNDLREPIALLRRALQHRDDPHSDMTMYTLANQLNQRPSTNDEGRRLFLRLVATSRFYRRLWYVCRLLGVVHWESAHELHHVEDHAGERRKAAEAAKWDGRAIRRRPRRWLQRAGPHRWQYRLVKIPRVPRMYRAAAEAHQSANHFGRYVYYQWRFIRLRRGALNRAWVAYQVEDDAEAIQFLQYVMSPNVEDDTTLFATVILADIERREGHHEQAKHLRRQAMHRDANRVIEIEAQLKRLRS